MLFFFPLTPHAFGSVFSIRNSDQFSNFSLHTLLSGLVRVCLKSYPRPVGRSVYLFTQPPRGVFLCNKQRAMRVCIFDFSIFLPHPFPTIIWRLGEIFINTHAKNAPFLYAFFVSLVRVTKAHLTFSSYPLALRATGQLLLCVRICLVERKQSCLQIKHVL